MTILLLVLLTLGFVAAWIAAAGFYLRWQSRYAQAEQEIARLRALAVQACELLAHHHDPSWKMNPDTNMCDLCHESKVFDKMVELGIEFRGRFAE